MGTSWIGTSYIMCANLLGAGVLALPDAMHYLGWAPGLGLIVVFGAGAVYSGCLIARFWGLVRNGPDRIKATNYGDLGFAAYGEPGRRTVNAVTYFYISAVTVVFHLASAQSLQALFYDVGGDLCTYHYSLIVCAIVVPLGQVQSLHGVSQLAIIGSATIMGTVAIAIVRLIAMGPLPDAEHEIVGPPAATSGKAFLSVNATVSIIFSYCGQAIFAELMSEMKKPEEFPKAVMGSTGLMTTTYLAVAAVGYWVLGSLAVSPLTNALPQDGWARAAAVCLFLHVLIAYVIELNILTKGAVSLLMQPSGGYGKISGGDTLGRRLKAAMQGRPRAQWLLASGSIVAGAFLLSNVCSFFTELASFAGSTGGIATTYIFPCAFIVKMDPRLGTAERRICKGIAILAMALAATGVVDTILDVQRKWADIGPPFSCMSCAYKRAHGLTPGVC